MCPLYKGNLRETSKNSTRERQHSAPSKHDQTPLLAAGPHSSPAIISVANRKRGKSTENEREFKEEGMDMFKEAKLFQVRSCLPRSDSAEPPQVFEAGAHSTWCP